LSPQAGSGKDTDPKRTVEKVMKTFEEEGGQTLREAKRMILWEKIESEQVRSALRFQMRRWDDLTRP